MQQAFRIRPILPEEYSEEAAVVHRAYAAGPYGEALEENEAWQAVERDTEGRNAAGQVLVAVDGGERLEPEATETVIGAVSVLRGESRFAKVAGRGEVELRLAAVDPAFQKRGIGEALLRAGIELARRWGCSAVRLDTGTENPAQSLYERLGFQRTPERDELIDESYGESLSYVYVLREQPSV